MGKDIVQENDKFELPEWLLGLPEAEIRRMKDEFLREWRSQKEEENKQIGYAPKVRRYSCTWLIPSDPAFDSWWAYLSQDKIIIQRRILKWESHAK